MTVRTDLEELDVAQQILSAVFTSTPDGLVVLDESLVILQANPTFCGWVGLPSSDVVNHFIGDVLASPQLVVAIHTLSASNCPSAKVELTVDTPVKRSLLANVAHIESERLRGWVVALNDQSERKRLEYQKMEFINIAAHELRTPLMAVIGFANLLMRGMNGSLNERHQEFLTSIIDGGRQLKAIVDEMLQFAHLDQGRLSDETGDSNVGALLQEVVNELQQRAAEKQVHITTLVEPDIVLPSGGHLLQTAINQLVLNGIGFNQPGGNVNINARRDGEAIVVQVADTGIGIAPADMEMIFQPFCQVEDHYIREVGGLGLGLSIAKRAVGQLGGTMSVDSTLGSGTTFTVRIPAFPQSSNDELSALQVQLRATKQQTQEYARDIQSLYSQLQKHSMATLASITELLEARDLYFRNHTERVTDLSLRIARQMGYSDWHMGTLETACRIHDIGKIGIPDAIINKAGRLTEQEEATMRQHVVLGRRIVEPLPFLQDASPIAFSHHERWDGQGYPDGLAGEEIPLGGRIIAVADAYLALVSPRSYREALDQQQALGILTAGAGSQWDPEIVEVLLELLREQDN